MPGASLETHDDGRTRMCYRCSQRSAGTRNVPMLRRLDVAVWECPRCGWLGIVSGAPPPSTPEEKAAWAPTLAEMREQGKTFEAHRRRRAEAMYMWGSLLNGSGRR